MGKPNPSAFKSWTRPVEGVGWDDAQAFIRGLKEKIGHRYRLLSKAEWEYVARAGTETKYSWGNEFDAAKVPNGYETAPVGNYAPNAFGLYDINGNVWE